MARPRSNPSDPGWVEYDKAWKKWDEDGRVGSKPLTPTKRKSRANPELKEKPAVTARRGKPKGHAKVDKLAADTPAHVRTRVREQERERDIEQARIEAHKPKVQKKAPKPPKSLEIHLEGVKPKDTGAAIKEFQDTVCKHLVRRTIARTSASEDVGYLNQCVECGQIARQRSAA